MLVDGFSRKFSYLRLSLTEACNFRCQYCLPEGFSGNAESRKDELTTIEVKRLLRGFRHSGFTKVRFTGGEPTIRPDLFEILADATRLGFQKRALSTNGWNLNRIASELIQVGLTHLNVSIDSLDEKRFTELTGKPLLPNILAGIEKVLHGGQIELKINAVLHRATAHQELDLFLNFIRTTPVSVRFIELMRTSKLNSYRDAHFLDSGSLRLKLLSSGFVPLMREVDSGPAIHFKHPDYRGTIGLIAPHSDGFCESCNRLRVNAFGRLRMCLFGEQDESLRPLLLQEPVEDLIREKLEQLLLTKPEKHFLHQGKSGMLGSFSEIGG